MPTYLATLSISPAFREAHFQALKPGGKLTGDTERWADAHVKYLRDLKARGKVLAAGPVAAFTWALVLLKVEKPEEATSLVEADPGVKAGLFDSFKVEPWFHMA